MYQSKKCNMNYISGLSPYFRLRVNPDWGHSNWKLGNLSPLLNTCMTFCIWVPSFNASWSKRNPDACFLEYVSEVVFENGWSVGVNSGALIDLSPHTDWECVTVLLCYCVTVLLCYCVSVLLSPHTDWECVTSPSPATVLKYIEKQHVVRTLNFTVHIQQPHLTAI